MSEIKWEIMPDEMVDDCDDSQRIITVLLKQRGINSPEEVEKFLYPTLGQLPSPELMLGIPEAVGILEDALEQHQPVVIYGDYDADGITSSALLSAFFTEIGLQVISYIPDRLSEGYGLNLNALRQLRNDPHISGAEKPVIVTVDCGIANPLEVAEARLLGFRVVVTDHHQPSEVLPEADAIVNPHQENCLFPYNELAGVGVAFYLIAGLRSRLHEKGFWQEGAQPNLKKYLDLVALGSIADMVPLTGVNRILVKAGMEIICEQPRPGISSLMAQAGMSAGRVDSTSIAYLLAPRINAAGRVGDPGIAIKLLISDDRRKTDRLAGRLEEANNLRKALAEKIFQEAASQAELQAAEGSKGLVLYEKSWHQGVIGLVASRIANSYCRPTVVLSCNAEGMVRGSCRSIDGLDILEVLEECGGLLKQYGGHKSAAGLSIPEENLAEFARIFKGSVYRIIGDQDLSPSIRLNYRASIDNLFSDQFLENYMKLEPFGNGNPEPVFGLEGEPVKLTDARVIGGNSLRFKLAVNGSTCHGVAFGMGHMLESILTGPVDLAFRIVRNDFRGHLSWEIRAEDIRSTT